MRMTLAEFLAVEARLNSRSGGHSTEALNVQAPESESKLHDQICAECESRLWGYVHSRMDKRTTNARGVCDFIVLADGGRVFLVECKMPKKKFSGEQLIFEAVAKRNGHVVHRVETIEEFLKLVA